MEQVVTGENGVVVAATIDENTGVAARPQQTA